MEIANFFRKIFRIPGKEYRDLFRQYSDAEASISSHIRDIRHFEPLLSTVKYQPSPLVHNERNMQVFVPRKYNDIGKITGLRESRLKAMGISVDDYDNCLALSQKAETAILQGDKSRAMAICDAIEEIVDTSKAQMLRDTLKRLRTIINKNNFR